MQATIFRPDIPAGTRLIAVSDMHSHASWMRILLDRVHFSGTDKLIFVGDAVGRGPENLAAVELLLELVEAGRAYAVSGNWDIVLVNMIMDESGQTDADLFSKTLSEVAMCGSSLFSDMCDRLALPLDSLEELRAARPMVLREFARELEFMRSLPAIIELPKLIFVHGGIPVEAVAALADSDQYALAKHDDFISHAPAFQHWVIVGHWPVYLYNGNVCRCTPYICDSKHIIDIDGGTGINPFGQLNALIIPDASAPAFELEWYDDLPVMTALDAQTASTNSVNVRWIHDQGVEVLQIEADSALVRFPVDGRTLWIPLARFGREVRLGNTYNINITDLQLGIQPGDAVSLIDSTAHGYFVKCNGVVGWYHGRLE